MEFEEVDLNQGLSAEELERLIGDRDYKEFLNTRNELYRERGQAFVPQYLDLLAAGGSDSPAALLARLGVDIQQPSFWQRGLGVLRSLVEEAQDLAG